MKQSADNYVPASTNSPASDPDRELDDALITRIARGNRAAFETLYFRHYARIRRYLSRMLNDAELVDEVVNDTMFAVWTSAARFDFRVRLTTWMFAIAHKKGLMAFASAARRAARSSHDAAESVDIENIPDPDTPHATFERRQAIEQIGIALQALSFEHRLTLELAFIEGLPYTDIAAVTSCPVNTVKTRVFHARKRLLQHIAGLEGAALKPEPGATSDGKRVRCG